MDDKVKCVVCGFESDFDKSDDIHGSMWECEKCGNIFCEKCFISKAGIDAYSKTVCDTDNPIVCVDCYFGKYPKIKI